MGAIGGLTGLAGGAMGTGFAKPTGTPLQTPVSTDQTNALYASNQEALKQQQGLVTALQGQNGIGNQSNVFDKTMNIANGQGPNPAQNMLNQATGANVANQAALMAGQRGSNANVGMMARQAAMQGANTQQQAVGQGATMQANQSLNALNQAGGIAGQQVSNQMGATTANTQAQQNEQQQLLNAIAQQNNARVGMQSNINNGNASLAGTTMNNQMKTIGGAMSGASMGAGARGGVVKYAAGGQIDEGSPAPIAPAGGDSGGGMASLAKMAPMLAAAQGGAVPGPQSQFGQFLAGWGGAGSSAPGAIDINSGNTGQAKDMWSDKDGQWGKKTPPTREDSNILDANQTKEVMGNLGGNSSVQPKAAPMPWEANSSKMPAMARGGKVPALVSPGERYLPPSEVDKVAKGQKSPMEAGEVIPGKPKVGGAKNDYANDTVPKTLEEGGIILPRSVTQAKNPHWAAHAFVSQIMAKQGLPTKGKKK